MYSILVIFTLGIKVVFPKCVLPALALIAINSSVSFVTHPTDFMPRCMLSALIVSIDDHSTMDDESNQVTIASLRLAVIIHLAWFTISVVDSPYSSNMIFNPIRNPSYFLLVQT